MVSLEILSRDLLPMFEAIKGKEIPSHTADTIIVAYKELFSSYMDQNKEVMKSMMKQVEVSNELVEFLTNKIS